jgi:predicted kinase
MSKVIITCGKICSGKTTYAEKLRIQRRGVVLSIDEVMLNLFDENLGDKHDEYVAKVKAMLLDKSLELIEVGIEVILDWGLWTKEERQSIREFYKSNGVECEIHYLDITDELWQQRINLRNSQIREGKSSAYYVDDGLAEKVNSIFEKPSDSEVDVWLKA